jgi:hypothetical protein
MIQAHWKIIWQFPKKLKHKLSEQARNPIPQYLPSKMKTYVHKTTYAHDKSKSTQGSYEDR